mmetsp:Transcript_67402/g.124050  ORF Transcript_67402/g.124050 Transcript_67402/m.124050 type:complete len:289 (-) Transcript_67402:203-1069(-)
MSEHMFTGIVSKFSLENLCLLAFFLGWVGTCVFLFILTLWELREFIVRRCKVDSLVTVAFAAWCFLTLVWLYVYLTLADFCSSSGPMWWLVIWLMASCICLPLTRDQVKNDAIWSPGLSKLQHLLVRCGCMVKVVPAQTPLTMCEISVVHPSGEEIVHAQFLSNDRMSAVQRKVEMHLRIPQNQEVRLISSESGDDALDAQSFVGECGLQGNCTLLAIVTGKSPNTLAPMPTFQRPNWILSTVQGPPIYVAICRPFTCLVYLILCFIAGCATEVAILGSVGMCKSSWL